MIEFKVTLKMQPILEKPTGIINVETVLADGTRVVDAKHVNLELFDNAKIKPDDFITSQIAKTMQSVFRHMIEDKGINPVDLFKDEEV